MTHVYIITSAAKRKDGLYKVGIHTGDLPKLIKRYTTPLPDLEIILFYPILHARNVEGEILRTLHDKRRKTMNGRLSEWVNIPLIDLIRVVIHYIEWADKICIRGKEQRKQERKVQSKEPARKQEKPPKGSLRKPPAPPIRSSKNFLARTLGSLFGGKQSTLFTEEMADSIKQIIKDCKDTDQEPTGLRTERIRKAIKTASSEKLGKELTIANLRVIGTVFGVKLKKRKKVEIITELQVSL
uniref:T5orf172 domain protein n=1 Tax=Pithovirus LCDPAC01 TaxID=2506600 RepID=A0A481YNM7_9VIRU|nr:MAG: T5orf172 domain protein [Pithovirus LCDPAC01]